MQNLLIDSVMQDADQQIRAALKAHGVKGNAAEHLWYELRRKVLRDDTGALMLELLNPWPHERYVFAGERRENFTEAWLQGKPEHYPLAEGLELWFSDKSPELELARRVHTFREEQRQQHVKEKVSYAAEIVQRVQELKHRDRINAWRKLPPDVRAVHRAGKNPTASRLAEAILSEQDATDPPEHFSA